MGGGGQPGAIPHTLSAHACVDFVNSRFTDHTGGDAVYDRLDMPEWRRWFAQRCGVTVREPLRAAERRELIALRDLLRRLLESRTAPDDAAVAALDHHLLRASASWRLHPKDDTFELQLRWREDGWRAVMAVVAASYADMLVTGALDRVRVCANPSCSYMFHDESRNGSRRWCDVAVCGNLVKVRRHRIRAVRAGAKRPHAGGRSESAGSRRAGPRG